jgi:tRNA-binding protein
LDDGPETSLRPTAVIPEAAQPLSGIHTHAPAAQWCFVAASGRTRRMTARAPQITFDDFLKVDIRVGRIVAAEPFPEARKPAYRLSIDFGPEIGVRKSSAQITRNHRLQDLPGRLVLAVVNFPPRQIGPMMSEVLTLGVPDTDGEVMLIGPWREVPVGGRLY